MFATAHQVLIVLSWFLIAVILSILLLIARFYQNVQRERTYFRSFSIPIVIFAAATARYAFIDQISGDNLGNLLWLSGGIILIGLCLYLYNLMTAGRKQ